MTKFKILGLLLLYAVQSSAQSNVMNLSQCLEYGLKNSPYVTLSNNELKMFKYDKRDLYSSYLPTLNASSQIDYNAKLPITVIPAGDFSPQEIRLKMGSPHANNVVLQLEQKIYDQSSIIGMRGESDYNDLSQLNSEKITEDLLYEIAMAYYRVLVVNQQISLLEDSKDQYVDLKKIMELQLEKGVIKDVDYNRILVAYNNINAQLSLIQTTKKSTLNYLKVMMGMPINSGLEINKEVNLLKEIAVPSAEDIDVSNRLDYQIMKKNIDLHTLNTKVTKYSFLPTLNGYARYGANGYGETLNDSWNNLYDFASVGISLRVPIFNGLKANTAYQKQKIQLENLKAQSEIMEESFKVELQNAATKILEAHTSLVANSENMELAKEVYETINLSYQKGAVSMTDFLNADYSYKEAQTNYLTSFINMLSSRLDYEKSKGNLKNYLNNL